MKKVIVIIILLVILMKYTSTVVFANLSTQVASDKGAIYLLSQQKPDGHVDGYAGVSEWAAMALVASGKDITIATASSQSLRHYLQTNPPTSSSTANDWSRKILMVTGTNQNPYDFGGINLVSGLEGYYTNNQIGSSTADNDDMFGLLALLSSNVDSTSSIMTSTLSFILSHQHTDGGFSYSTDSVIGSDIDDTAVALMTLEAAQQASMSSTLVKSSIDNAKKYILSHQNIDGGFSYDPNPATSWDTTSNVSTTTWALMALNSLGLISTVTGTNAQQYLLSIQQSNGSFPYNLDTTYGPVTGDTFDTSFAILALTGRFWPLHIFSGIVPTITGTSTPIPTPTTILKIITPTPTNIQLVSPIPTVTPTPLITNTPIPTMTPIIATSVIISVTPTDIPASRRAVLGEKINSTTPQKKVLSASQTDLFIPILFASFGSISMLVYLGKMGYNYFIQRRKE